METKEEKEEVSYPVTVLVAGTVGRSGIVYSKEVLEKAVEEFNKRREGKKSFGEDNQPRTDPWMTPEERMRRNMIIDYSNVSHEFTLSFVDNAVKAQVKPLGKYKDLIEKMLKEDHISFGVRGEMKYDPFERKVDELTIYTIDIVLAGKKTT